MPYRDFGDDIYLDVRKLWDYIRLEKPRIPIMPRKPSKRRTISKTSTKAQTLNYDRVTPEEVPAKRCYLKNMPNEIMGIIFGLLDLHDLGSMLCVSKWINVYFFMLEFG